MKPFGARSAKQTALAVVVVASLGSACGGSSARAAVPRSDAGVRATIMFVGDSNVAYSLSALATALTDRDQAYQVIDVARAGTGIRTPDCHQGGDRCPSGDYWKIRLPDALQHVTPDGFVVNLGINDTSFVGAATGPGYAAYGAKIDWLMHLLPAAKPVWWSNLPCVIEPKDRAAGCAAVNDALAAAAHRWRNLVVIDWAATADGHQDYLFSNLKGIHLSGPGAQAYANLVAKALDHHFPT